MNEHRFMMDVLGGVFARIEKAYDAAGLERATLSEEMHHIAGGLYDLRDVPGRTPERDVPGRVVECGSYKGFSSCCLSWAADLCGPRPFTLCDSFHGLPDVGDDFYSPGEYAGDELLVRTALESFGRRADFLPGWFEDTLPVWDSGPIALLWLDVDLYESATTVLENLVPRLSHGGLIYTHEIEPGHIREGKFQADGSKVARAFHDYLCGKRYTATYLTGYLARVDLQ